MNSIARVVVSFARYWHSPPWQAAFYAEARGHSLRTRIGRLLEPAPGTERTMKRTVIVLALLACFAAGSVRVKLVAQESQNKPALDTGNAAVDDSVPKVLREELRYDGKSFEEWQRTFQTELKTERRTEAVQAMAVFAQNGYAAEATDTVLSVLVKNKSAARTQPQQEFLAAIRAMLEDADATVVAPKLAKILNESDNAAAQSVALAVLGSHAYRESPTADALLAYGTNNANDSTKRFNALTTLLMVEKTNPKLIDAIRGQIADAGKGGDKMLGKWMALAVMSPGYAYPLPDGAKDGSGEYVVREALVPILIDGLRSKVLVTRATAQQLLGEAGGAIQQVLPTLLEMGVSEADEEVRMSAGYAVIGNAITSPAEMQTNYQSLATPDQLRFLKLMQNPEWGASSAIESSWLSFFTLLSEDEHEEIRESAKELVQMLTARQKQSPEGRSTPYGPGVQPTRPK